MFEEKKSINETRLQRVNYKGQEKKTVMKKSITKQKLREGKKYKIMNVQKLYTGWFITQKNYLFTIYVKNYVN